MEGQRMSWKPQFQVDNLTQDDADALMDVIEQYCDLRGGWVGGGFVPAPVAWPDIIAAIESDLALARRMAAEEAADGQVRQPPA